MKHYFLACLSTLALAPQMAAADNIADCEIVLMETIEDESGRGGAKIASYRPATEFMESIYLEDQDPLLKVDGLKIQAIMCKRLDMVPTKNDFNIVATGIPFFLSQSFESQDTDLVTVFFKEGRFQHVYTGPGLSEDTLEALEDRLAVFTEGDHNLAEKEAEKKKLAKRDADKDPVDTKEVDTKETDEETSRASLDDISEESSKEEAIEEASSEKSESEEVTADESKDTSEAFVDDSEMQSESETLLEVEEDSE